MSRAEVQAEITAAMGDELIDAVVSVTYEAPAAGYDPTTSTITAGATFTGDAIRWDDIDMEMDDEDDLMSYIKLLIVKSDYVTIPEVDFFATISGEKYQIVKVETDPFDATATFKLKHT